MRASDGRQSLFPSEPFPRLILGAPTPRIAPKRAAVYPAESSANTLVACRNCPERSLSPDFAHIEIPSELIRMNPGTGAQANTSSQWLKRATTLDDHRV
jgi:hypothetical protein